jgi:hypothetical protein
MRVFVIYTRADSTLYCYFDQIKEDGVGWAGSRGGNGKGIQNFVGKMEARGHVGKRGA